MNEEKPCCMTCKWCHWEGFGLGGFRELYCDYTKSRYCACNVHPDDTCEKWESSGI